MHSDVVDPPSDQVRKFVEDLVVRSIVPANADSFGESMEQRFGPVRPALVARARRMALVGGRRGTKRKGGPGAEADTGERDSRKVIVEAAEDVAWAAATLAPMGMKADVGEPLVRAPAAVVLPIFAGLRALAGLPDFVALLKQTSIGKVVAGYRHDPNQEVGKAAKDLVMSWKAACQTKGPR